MTIKPGWCRIELLTSDVAVLELHGEHDVGTISEVTSAFESRAGQERNVVLDLTSATFIDSAVLHAIYSFAGRKRDAGKRVALQVGSESVVRRALEVAGLLDSLPCAEQREDAVALVQDD